MTTPKPSRKKSTKTVPRPARRPSPRKPGHSAAPADDIPFALPRVSAKQKERAERLLAALAKEYPGAKCELNYTSPHELLVATILSAQSTDAGVNKVTPALFERFPTPADYAKATPAEIEPYIRSTGFFRNKAKAVHSAMSDIAAKYKGEVPRTMDELLALHGVARKTANVVLGNAYRINVGIPIDTHIQRLSQRFRLAPEGSSVAMIERYLMALFPREHWCDISHRLIWHGRRACKARNKSCDHPICREFGDRCEVRRNGTKARSRNGTE